MDRTLDDTDKNNFCRQIEMDLKSTLALDSNPSFEKKSSTRHGSNRRRRSSKNTHSKNRLEENVQLHHQEQDVSNITHSFQEVSINSLHSSSSSNFSPIINHMIPPQEQPYPSRPFSSPKDKYTSPYSNKRGDNKNGNMHGGSAGIIGARNYMKQVIPNSSPDSSSYSNLRNKKQGNNPGQKAPQFPPRPAPQQEMFNSVEILKKLPPSELENHMNHVDEAKEEESEHSDTEDLLENRPVKKFFQPFHPTRNQEDYLKGQFIIVLKKQSDRFPDAHFFCTLCSTHWNTFDRVKTHAQTQQHCQNVKEEQNRIELERMPFPNEYHVTSLSLYLEHIYAEHSLCSQEIQIREIFVERFKNLLRSHPHLKSCTVRVFGSVATGFALKTSDLNMELVIGPNDNASMKMNQLFEFLKQSSDLFVNVKSDFRAKYPKICFHAKTYGLNCSFFLLSSNNHHLTSRLLHDYLQFSPLLQKLGIIFRYWAKVCHLDLQEKGALPRHAFPILAIYFMQQHSPPLLPVLHEYKNPEDEYPDIEAAKEHWSKPSHPLLGELWLKLLKYYALTFVYGKQVATITDRKPVDVKDKSWSSRMMAIEEPFNVKRNLARTFSSQQVFKYFLNHICEAYKYFGKACTFSQEEQKWSFDRENFNPKMIPLPIMCKSCNKSGHLKDDCPDFQLPPLKPLPPLTKDHEEKITQACEKLFRELLPTSHEAKNREILLDTLQRYIRQIYPDANLQVFGSSKSGFGFTGCDMDLCMTFQDKEEMEFAEDQVYIIETLALHLKACSDYTNVIPITTAKVPIVKFRFAGFKIEADISLYNTLAQHNTRMLLTYSQIDYRVQVLGFIMKKFAKIFEIGDASCGSLSSYAYILMVIYFLQQRNPPVVPVLQELYDHLKPKPQRMVKEWNVWYFDDLGRLELVWPDLGSNTESIGKLWVELLKFYTETFNFEELVISIRQLRPMSRLEKLWNSKCIVIEDPFDLFHNLGSGLSRKMDIFIKKAFISGRNIFGAPLDKSIFPYRSLKNYLFSKDVLTNGLKPPNERCCRICNKIGHKMRDCPSKRKSSERKKKKTNSNEDIPNEAHITPEDVLKFLGDREENLPPETARYPALNSPLPFGPGQFPPRPLLTVSSPPKPSLLPLPSSFPQRVPAFHFLNNPAQMHQQWRQPLPPPLIPSPRTYYVQTANPKL